jgi:2-polyprenyl-6-methoxyphenol hydroxylase-like FAD-dependent oxidoreductase
VISPMGAKGMNLALYDAETFVNAARDKARLAWFTEPSSAAALAWGELMTGLA